MVYRPSRWSIYTLADLFGCFSPKQPDNTVESVKASSSSDWVRSDKVGCICNRQYSDSKIRQKWLKIEIVYELSVQGYCWCADSEVYDYCLPLYKCFGLLNFDLLFTLE